MLCYFFDDDASNATRGPSLALDSEGESFLDSGCSGVSSAVGVVDDGWRLESTAIQATLPKKTTHRTSMKTVSACTSDSEARFARFVCDWIDEGLQRVRKRRRSRCEAERKMRARVGLPIGP